jgi:hypothetical protein
VTSVTGASERCDGGNRYETFVCSNALGQKYILKKSKLNKYIKGNNLIFYAHL